MSLLLVIMLFAGGCAKEKPGDVVIDVPTDEITTGTVTGAPTEAATEVKTDEPAVETAEATNVVTDVPTDPANTEVQETITPEPSVSPEPETASPDPSNTETVPDPTPNATPSGTPTPPPPTKTATPTPAPTATPTGVPTATPTKEPTPTKTPEPTPTKTPVYDEPNNIFSSWDERTIEAFRTTAGKQTSIELTDEGVKFTWTATAAADPFVYLDITKYVNLTGKKPLSGIEGSYLVFKVKADKCDGTLEVFTQTPVSGDSAKGKYTSDGSWHYVLVDMTATTLIDPATLTKIRIDWSSVGSKAGASMILSEIAFYSDYLEAANRMLTGEELGQYAFNNSPIDDVDPLAEVVLTAPDEDASVKLWFEQTTERVVRNDTKAGKRTGYTVKMAKNEVENAQFIVAPGRAMKIRVEVDEFKDDSGNTVPFELAYEWYHNIRGTFTPDALIPYTGAVSVAAGNSQGFVIRITTLPDTKAGTYNSIVHIFDDDTGKEIKRAKVAAKVWNFALSEETALRTAFANWASYIYSSYNHDKYPEDYLRANDIEGIYYDFFLKYRINIMDIPHGLTSGYASNKINSNPRINTLRWTNLDVSVKDDGDGVWPAWMDKVIYYAVDEPGGRSPISSDLAKLLDAANRVRANTPQYRMVCPFERNLDLTEDGKQTSFSASKWDMIGFMQQAINIWCVKMDAFTPRELSRIVTGASFLQSTAQDEKYGTFPERMKARVAEGDELWAYIAINPVQPYVNWQLISDGTEAITTMWQLKQNDITGLLYWAVDYWKVNYWGTEPWAANQYGDGFLVYSGYSFDLLDPIPSMRLESIRDGIEDYQMLCMLEEKLGSEAVDDIIRRISTSVVTFCRDDDHIHAVRKLLGDMLEKELG